MGDRLEDGEALAASEVDRLERAEVVRVADLFLLLEAAVDAAAGADTESEEK